jgi:hypothetical protein
LTFISLLIQKRSPKVLAREALNTVAMYASSRVRAAPRAPCFCRATTLLALLISCALALVALGNWSVWQRRACDERVAAAERAAAQGALAMVGRPGAQGADADADEIRRLRAQVAYLTSDTGGARERVVHAPPEGGAAQAAAPAPPAVRRAPLAPPRRDAGEPAAPAARGAVEPAPAAPSSARAVVIFCYNRPDYLRRTLRTLLARLPAYNRPHVYVSQDGEDAGVTAAVAEAGAEWRAAAPDVPFTHWRHSNKAGSLRGSNIPGWATSYYALAQHFGWALSRLFGERQHPSVIILEDDLEVAVDFFDYMSAMEPLLDADSTLLGVSAYNDLGQPHLVLDARAVYRSDFFPGLGWMLSAHGWEELGPKWPDGFWDDWLREPPQRKGRHFLRPEVRRAGAG